jgi:hypothetical protein
MLTPEQRQRAREIAAQAPPLSPAQRDLIARIFARRRPLARSADKATPLAGEILRRSFRLLVAVELPHWIKWSYNNREGNPMDAEDKRAMDQVARKLWGMLPERLRVHELQLMGDEDAGAMLELLGN